MDMTPQHQQPASGQDDHDQSVLDTSEIQQGERLLQRLTAFGHLLWEAGLPVTTQQILDLAETLQIIDITRRDDFYQALKCSLLTRHEQEALFDQMFAYFWFIRDNTRKKAEPNGRSQREERKMRLPPSERQKLAEQIKKHDQRHDVHGDSHRNQHQPARKDDEKRDNENGAPQEGAYSAIEQLTKKILRTLPGKRYRKPNA